MFSGEVINTTEKRQVLHVALRMGEDQTVNKSPNAVKEVHEVLNRIKCFSEQVRKGEIKGYSGKPLTNILAIGIGGSFLGPEFVFESLKFDTKCREASQNFKLRFLANVDPVDFNRAIQGLDIEETLVVIVSKTFTTAETMLNAKTVKEHIMNHYAILHPAEQDKLKFV